MNRGMFVGGTPTSASDLAPLGERLAALFVTRVVVTTVIAMMLITRSDLIGSQATALIPATIAFFIASCVTEGVRRVLRGRGLVVVGGMLLMDGIFLSWVMFVSGGPQSPLRFLIYLHLIAVTLLASYRTGLKVALWHSLLFFVTFYAQLSGWIDPFTSIEGSAAQARTEFNRLSVLNVVAFWLVALGTAAYSAMNERELRRNRDDLRYLTEMAAQLEEVTHPKQVAEILLSRLKKAFGYSRGAVIALQGNDLELLGFTPGVEADKFETADDPLLQRAWLTHSVEVSGRLSSTGMLSTLFPDARNIVVVPMYAGRESVGALIVEYPPSLVGIERRILSMYGQFASHAALALRNVWLMQHVTKMARTDPLTGLDNRAAFHDSLEQELARAGRGAEEVTLMMIDIDHFKQINDVHGHQIGDEALRHFAAAVSEGIRSFDRLARYGGEEFALIAPTCNADQAVVAAERLRAIIEESSGPVPMTASIGVATYPTHGQDPDKLIKAADQALYAAKEAGRNIVSRFQAPALVETFDEAEDAFDDPDDVFDDEETLDGPEDPSFATLVELE
ncbi:MAG TPA: sensor domain-containing diguanylate cyclase [Actinomycetota bacterium]|nr:sensor domain-containing diguanylate cyclase [Actinomycetota bacterium]